MRSFYTWLTHITETAALISENVLNTISFPHRFRKEAFGSKKPSKKARKGTFEGQVVAGTKLELKLIYFNSFNFILIFCAFPGALKFSIDRKISKRNIEDR